MHTDLIELRQYLLHPGRRDELIRLFDDELIAPQEAVGMSVLGQFTDPDRPDHFVWVRAFDSMSARHAGLTAFYGGPVWAAARDTANSTMIDSDDVHLLRAVCATEQLPPHDPARRHLGRTGFIVIAIVPGDERAVGEFLSTTGAHLETLGIRRIGLYATAHEPNDYPGLPVHASPATVWFGSSTDADAWDAVPELSALWGDRGQLHRLLPTARSVLDGSDAGG